MTRVSIIVLAIVAAPLAAAELRVDQYGDPLPDGAIARMGKNNPISTPESRQALEQLTKDVLSAVSQFEFGSAEDGHQNDYHGNGDQNAGHPSDD
jgi:hypothetical protein